MLIQRLFHALRNDKKNPNLVVFAGSGLTHSVVPGVGEVMDMVDQFSESMDDDPKVRAMFQEISQSDISSAEKYGRYQQLLDNTHGSGTFDRVIQHAVRTGYRVLGGPTELATRVAVDPWMALDEFAAAMEDDLDGWRIPVGLQSLARIIASNPDRMSPIILTTNFDPLIEIALRREGISTTTINLPVDGSIEVGVVRKGAAAVVHLHGYWWRTGGTTRHGNLHSDLRLRTPRPALLADMRDILAGSVMLVVGYGGWGDIFSTAIAERARDGFDGLLWALHATAPAEYDRIRAMLLDDGGQPVASAIVYTGVDCDRLFPALDGKLTQSSGLVTNLHLPEDVVRLSSDEAESVAFGAKISNLARLKRGGVAVPEGLAIALPAESADWSALAKKIVSDLDADPETRAATLIVRSSASVEDQPNALFPGIFDSPRDIKGEVQLTAAIDQCHRSMRSPAVNSYLESMNRAIDPRDIRMSVLVQRQVESLYSGVAFTARTPPLEDYDLLVQLSAGASAAHLRGIVGGSLFGFIDSRNSAPEHLGGESGNLAETAAVLEQVRLLVLQVKSVLVTENLDLEWAWDGTTAYAVQARSLPEYADTLDDVPLESVPDDFADPEPGDALEGRVLPIEGAQQWGHKGAASVYFDQEIGGAKNVKFVPPGASKDEIAEILKSRSPSPMGTTIRFSHKTRLSLPRRFIGATEDVLEHFIQLRADPDWLGIVSDFVHVQHSFEAYLGENDLLVEHVPGNWETDNMLPPDIFLWSGAPRFLRVARSREARYELPGEQNERRSVQSRVPPLTAEHAEAMVTHFLPKLKQIKKRFAQELPLNVHFTSDDDGWYFLNIRPTDELDVSNLGTNPDGTFRLNRLYLVAKGSDLRAWDGQTEIVMTVSEDRARFAHFIKVARELRDLGVKSVYCTFGLLSHPAILMRELGIQVKPLLLTHEEVPISMGGWE